MKKILIFALILLSSCAPKRPEHEYKYTCVMDVVYINGQEEEITADWDYTDEDDDCYTKLAVDNGQSYIYITSMHECGTKVVVCGVRKFTVISEDKKKIN